MKQYEANYEIVSKLGSGGMSKVFLVKHKRLDTLWAMKEIPKNADMDFDLLSEANVLKRLNHPTLPRIIDVYDEADSIYIIEDYIEGVSIDKLLLKNRLPEKQVRDIAAQLCNVLDYLHSQKPNPIIYRDMKPSNIILTEDGSIKLIDFGIAREYKSSGSSDTALLGTLGYAAPEQFGSTQTDVRSDIYSLGVTLYHMISGVNPSSLAYKPEYPPSTSKQMERIIERCTKARPEERFQSVREVLSALESKTAKLPKESKSPSRYDKISAADILKLAVCIAIIASGVLLVVIGGTKSDSKAAYGELYTQGYKLMAQREYAQAQLLLSEADSASNQCEGSAALILALAEAGYMEECISFAEEAARAHPELAQNAQVNCSWGIALESLNRYDEALTKFLSASKQAPDDLLYIGHLARAYANCGDMEAANHQLERMTAFSDDAATAFVHAGILNATGEYQAAMAEYSKCAENASDSAMRFAAYKEISELCKQLRSERTDYAGYLDEQINALEQMRQLFANKDEAYILESLGEAYYLKGMRGESNSELDRALECFQELLRLGYGRISTYINMSVIQRGLGKYSQAEDTLLALLDKYPGTVEAYIELAFTAAEREGSKEQAERSYSDVLKYYELAKEHGAKGDKLQRLEGIIGDLRTGGWI